MAGALGVVITTDVPVSGQHAQPVYVDDTLPIVGPSQAIVVTSGEVPQMGGPALAVRLAPAGTPAIGPALPVYVVSGSLDNTTPPPVNSVLPVISGAAVSGQTLSTTNGTWTGTPTYTYQWYRNGIAIGGATNSTYLLTDSDNGTTITVIVTATNAGGSTSATSAAVVAATFLFLDRFPNPESAPIASPHTNAPGPGTITTVDTGSKISVTASGMQFASQTVSQTDPVAKDTLTWARVPGRTFRIKTTLMKCRVGWAQSGSANTDAIGILISSGSVFVFDLLGARSLAYGVGLVDGTQYTFECVMRDQGSMMFVTGGIYTTRQLLWLVSGKTQLDDTTTPLRAIVGYGNATSGIVLTTEFSGLDYGGVWGERFGLATDYNLFPAALPVTINSTSNGIYEVIWPCITAETLTILFRRTDDSNCWKIVCDQAAGTIKLYSRVAGVDTEIDSGKTQTWSNGSTFRITIRADGTRIISAVEGIIKHNTTSGTTIGTTIKVSGPASISYVDSFPLTGFPEPAQANLPKNLFFHGDSKTVGSGDTLPPPTGYGGCPPLLIASLEATTANGWYERPSRVATGGATVAALKASIDASLAAAIGTPDYVFTNMGINDSAALPVEATWKTNYAYILDAFHAKWPSAIIKVAYVWAQGRDANCTTLNSWIAFVLSTRAWAAVGLDEQIVLKGSDDGATNTTDGIHPNRIGYTLVAAAWKASMGY